MTLPKSKKPPKGRRVTDAVPDASADEKKQTHWSDYMYASYNAETEVISLYRILPKEHLGIPTVGWLDDVEPGMFEPYIREHYGGGQYRLNKRSRKDGQISASCTFDLPGFPKVSSAANPTAAVEGQGATEPVMLTVDGVQVPYTGDLQKFADFMMLMKGIKSVFPDPPPPPADINAGLLELVLKKDTTDPLDTIRTLKEASDLFGGAGQTGSNVYDLINTAIQQAGPVIQAMASPDVRRLAKSAPLIPGAGPGNGSGKRLGAVPVKAGDQAGQVTDITPQDPQAAEDEPSTEERGFMSQRDLILAVVSTIVSCWKLDPPKTAQETVRMVDLVLQQGEPTLRQTLADMYKDTIFDICETQLSEDWSLDGSTVGNRKDFGQFFIAVFGEYARPDREVLAL